MTSRVGRERRLDPIDLILRLCTTRRASMTYFFWLHVHGLRGTRRTQIFFYVPYEPQAINWKDSRTQQPHTSSTHFFALS